MLDNTEIIYEWNLNELWAYCTAQEDELNKKNKEKLETIKYGYKISVHINYLKDKHYIEHPEHNLAIINKKKVPIHELWDEIQLREKELRKIIIELQIKEEPYTPR